MTEQNDHSALRKFKPGKPVEAEITGLAGYAAFATVNGGVRGLIPARELSWDPQVTDPSQVLSIGKTARCVVTRVDTDRDRLVLSPRRAGRDPWNSVEENYSVGQVVRGTVVRVGGPGYFIEVDEGLDALLIKSDVKGLKGTLLIGDAVEARVTERSRANRTMHLSVREHLAERQKEFSSEEAVASGASFAELAGLQWAEVERKLGLRDDGKSTSPALTPATTPRKILVIDDDEEVAGSLVSLLSELGHNASSCSSVQRILDSHEEDRWDLLLMDVAMPNVRGTEAARTILERSPDARIVLLTAIDMADVVPEVKDLPLAGVLQKPPDAEDLAEVVAELGRDPKAAGQHPASPQQGGSVGLEHAGAGRLPWEKETEAEASFRALERLATLTGAEMVALFGVDPVTLEVSAIDAIGVDTKLLNSGAADLRFSPVADVVRDGGSVLEDSASRDPRREATYHYLLSVIPFNSCLGVPVEVFGRPHMSLFAFHSAESHFTEVHLMAAEACSMAIGAAVERTQAWQRIQADEKFAAVGRVASGLAHELRNDLTVLNSSIQNLELRLRKYGKHPGNPGQLVTSLQENVSRLTKAKNSIGGVASMFLTFVRGEAAARTNVNECVRRAAEVIESEADRCGVSVKTKLDPSLAEVQVCRVALQQLLINLLLNGVQQIREYTNSLGMVEVASHLDKAAEALPVKIAVRDTGPGIHSRDLPSLFDPLVTTREGGTGLGLYVSRHLAESMGGQLRVLDTRMSVGTTFLVELPMSPDRSTE